MNIAWGQPKAGLISSLSQQACTTCANLEREAAKSVANRERVIGQSIVLTTVDTSDATNPGKLTVLAIGYQPESLVVDFHWQNGPDTATRTGEKSRHRAVERRRVESQ